MTYKYFSQGLSLRDVLPLLQDGHWHSLTELVGELAEMIPPEVAIRLFRISRNSKAGTGVDRKLALRVPVPLERQIAKGNRLAVSRALAKKFRDRKGIDYRREVEGFYRLRGVTDGTKETATHKTSPRRRHATAGGD